MTMREAFVKERNDALFSMDRKKIEAYCAKHGDTETAELRISYSGPVYIKQSARSATHPKIKCGKLEHGLRLMVSQTP